MFNIGGSELLVILFVALIFLGPERLPTAARQLGKTITQLRQMAAGFQREFEDAVNLGEEQANLSEQQARANGAALVAADTATSDSDPDASDESAAAIAAEVNDESSDAELHTVGFDPTAAPDRTEKPLSNDGPMFHSAAPGAGPQRKQPTVDSSSVDAPSDEPARPATGGVETNGSEANNGAVSDASPTVPATAVDAGDDN